MRELKSTSGLLNEKKASLTFHAPDNLPLLISPATLRSRNLGQIDLARLVRIKGEWRVEIAEVKSSRLGEKNFVRIQKDRLYGSLHFLCGIFGAQGHLTVIVG